MSDNILHQTIGSDMRIVANIEGEDIIEHEDSSVSWRAKLAVDCDGIGPHHGDPCAQSDTSLHYHGQALNADVDRYIVVPPAIIHGVKGTVLGCYAKCKNVRNGKECDAVVGDIGPHKKLGEASCATAAALGLNPSPTRGGTDDHIIEYTIYPGVAAIVDGKTYTLQPSNAS